MPTTSTTRLPPSSDRQVQPRQGWLHLLRQRDRLWLLLVILMFVALFLSGCHARSGGQVHASSCGSSSADGALTVFYVVYLLGWILVTSAGG